MPKLWPHQIKALRTLWALLESGERRICLTSPTGGGKTVMLKELIAELVHQGKKVALYTNRVMLTEQTSTVLDGFGVSHGVRASGFEHHLGEQAQVCSLMTEYARCIKTHRWDLHKADVVFVDEAHTQKRRIGTYILNKHIEQGAAIVGVSYSPGHWPPLQQTRSSWYQHRASQVWRPHSMHHVRTGRAESRACSPHKDWRICGWRCR